MSTLLIGFDSAWTRTNSGALVGLLHSDDGKFRELGPPQIVDYPQAEAAIADWQARLKPASTVILLDQPTVVTNNEGQRPVEHIVGSAVSLRYGGMQPANKSRQDMFGAGAPIWPFLSRFGGSMDLPHHGMGTQVIETYPVLVSIALLWTLPDNRSAGRLPKYNPGRKKTFSITDWQHICEKLSASFHERGLEEAVRWIDDAAKKPSPRKKDQDCVDAYICLLVALFWIERKQCLMVGNSETGYIVVPYGAAILSELESRCERVDRPCADWLRVLPLLPGN